MSSFRHSQQGDLCPKNSPRGTTRRRFDLPSQINRLTQAQELRVDELLVSVQQTPWQKLNMSVVPVHGKTNSWALEPQFVKAIHKVKWPENVHFTWFDDLYP